MKTSKVNLFIFFSIFFFTIGCGSRPNDNNNEFENVVFVGSTNDSIEVLKNIKYNKRASEIYKWTSDYLKSAYDNMDITGEEYSIQSVALRGVYSKLVNDKVLEVLSSSNCSHNHSILNELLREVNTLVNLEINKDLLSQLKKNKSIMELHNSIIAFGASVQSKGKTAQSVYAQYDIDYADKVLAQARNYQYPYNCASIEGAIKGVKPKLDNRHRAFLETLVSRYSEQAEYDYDIYAKVSEQIDKYYYQGSSGEGAVKYGTSASARDFTRRLIRQMEDFNNEKQ